MAWPGLLVAYLFPWGPSWLDIGLPIPVRWAGLVASLVPLGFLCWVFKAIGRAGAKYVVTFDEQPLVTTGPYARVRHPMYSGSVVSTYTWRWRRAGRSSGSTGSPVLRRRTPSRPT